MVELVAEIVDECEGIDECVWLDEPLEVFDCNDDSVKLFVPSDETL